MSARNAESLDLEIAALFGDGKISSQPGKKPLPFKPRKNAVDRNLEGALTSALLAGDKQLDHVIRELESLATALRNGRVEGEERVALHPAVWYAVRQVLLEKELRHLALSDDLTCLYNRRGFYAAAMQQLKIAQRQGKPAVLFFCDLDGLKQINDTYGHREGDFALVRTADALEEAFRDSDVLARLGGDEFAVLAMDLSSENRQAILNRLHRSLRKAAKDELRCALSVSVGSAAFDPQNPVSLGELMEQADHAMYEEKRRRFGNSNRDGAPFRRNNIGGGAPDEIAVIKRKI
jgi:diguanylate cyclase (GGDEF)-like protein